MKLFTIAAATLAVTGVLVATSSAQGATTYAQTISDPTGDVVAEDTEVWNVPVKRSVGIAGGADASSVRISHTPGYVTAQLSAPNLANGSRIKIDLRASGRKYTFSWRYAEYRSLFQTGGDLIVCASTVNRTFGTTDRAVVKIPRTCLGSPNTVSARTMLWVGRTWELDCRDRETDYEGSCKDPIGTARYSEYADIEDASWTSFLAVKQ